jgi:hypothetical protein
MDGIAAARTLTRRAVGARERGARRGEPRFVFAVAAGSDDAEVRRLLRETPLPGSVQLSLEREPEALGSAGIEGDVHDVIVARERATGRLAAIASRSSRERYVNGRASRVGYLGQLRVAPAFRRHAGLLDDGFESCRGLRGRDGASIHLASVVAENAGARRLLERGRSGWPVFRVVDRLATFAIPARPGRLRGDAAGIVPGDRVGISDLAAVLDRFNRRHQFAPCWRAEEIEEPGRLRGLQPRDFLVALDRGSVAGCLAIWDQRSFKQVVVRGYAGALGRWRPLVNLLGPVFGAPRLPPVGSQLQFAYLSHLAVDDDDPEVAIALVGEALRGARERGIDYVALGLSASGPLAASIQRTFAHRRYESVLYAVVWPDSANAADALDRRPSHPEIAIL